ncbi:MAG: sigma-70 family RNA polymerase sigma factor [Polyangiaceae bacterium]
MAGESDDELVERAKSGVEDAFATLLERHYPATLRTAQEILRSNALAEEVTQEAWMSALDALPSFEGRSSFRTWVTRIVLNGAKRRRVKEARTVPISALGLDESFEPAVPAERFAVSGRWPGHWQEPPSPWKEPEEALFTAELRELVTRAIEALPDAQRVVITMRDLLGLSAVEACDALEISEANQRVLLHRARSRVRTALEGVLGWAP